MHSLPVLLAVASLWSLAVVSPGPNSILVMRISLGRPRTRGLRAVAGIGVGTLIWGLTGFFGVHALFLAVPFLYWALRICGGVYLVVFGLRLIWTSLGEAPEPAPVLGRLGWGPFRLGLATSLSNPKSALSVAGLFAATMPSAAPLGLGLTAVALMVAISMAWYAVLVQLFTARWVAGLHGALRRAVDRIAGAVFIFFGARLVLDR